jgi:ketosteroid isomerase-like protein
MAIRTNPSYATAHENLGDVYAKLASQAYNKALQLDNSNTAVAPKLALIRELFSANGVKGQRPTTAPLAVPPPPSTLAPAANSAATVPPVKPPPTLPTQAAAKPVTNVPSPAPVPVAAPTPVVTAVASAPAAVTPNPAPAPSASNNQGVKEAEAAVKAWASAWSAKDVKAYLASYGKDFTPPGGMGRNAWEEERKARINGKANISVKLENLNVSVNGSKATAKFRQDYKAGGLSVQSRKTLDLIKSGDRWHIVKESVGN